MPQEAVQVYVELTGFATANRRELAAYVTALQDAGGTGVSVSDRLFGTQHGEPRAVSVQPTCEPLTTLAAVAALSDRLVLLQTVVANTAWQHPALLLRQFAQLAVLAGGQRVTAGLGAGWSTEEFDAIGLSMPPFRPRMDRLAEVLALARALFVDGSATVDGAYVSAKDLPLSRGRRSGHGSWSAAARTGSCGWPAGTPTSSTCTAIPGTARWSAPAGRRRGSGTPAAAR